MNSSIDYRSGLYLRCIKLGNITFKNIVDVIDILLKTKLDTAWYKKCKCKYMWKLEKTETKLDIFISCDNNCYGDKPAALVDTCDTIYKIYFKNHDIQEDNAVYSLILKHFIDNSEHNDYVVKDINTDKVLTKKSKAYPLTSIPNTIRLRRHPS